MNADSRRVGVGRGRRRWGRSERGTALIEFALVFPFLLVLTLCVIDISRAFWIKNVVHQAAREGVRYLAVHTLADSAGVRARVQQVTSAANVTLKTLTPTGPDADRMMSVNVGVQFDWIFPGLFNWVGGSFANPMTISATAWMRKEG
jgi:Flp pilus assembly protein TadG